MAEKIDLSPYEFVDFGCSAGGSITFAKRAFKAGRALGIDINQAKIEKTKALGWDAILADATDHRQFKGRVRFSMLSHFLEHLPDLKAVKKAINTAIRISDDFVFIRQPWFDSDGELFRHGLKFYWSDWHGHPMTLTTLQMYLIARRHLSEKRIVRLMIFGNTPVQDTDHESVLPLSAPMDSGTYDADLHGPKPMPAIPLNAYKETVVVLAIKDTEIASGSLRQFPHLQILRDELAPASSAT